MRLQTPRLELRYLPRCRKGSERDVEYFAHRGEWSSGLRRFARGMATRCLRSHTRAKVLHIVLSPFRYRVAPRAIELQVVHMTLRHDSRASRMKLVVPAKCTTPLTPDSPLSYPTRQKSWAKLRDDSSEIAAGNRRQRRRKISKGVGSGCVANGTV